MCNSKHNINYRPSNPNMPNKAYKHWLNSIFVRKETKSELRELYVSDKPFNSRLFIEKVKITKKCTPCLYYRKMSQGEFDAIKPKLSTDPFTPAFDYTNTRNYRYWVSSSFAKVKDFGNENSSDSGEVIVEFVFKKDMRKPGTWNVQAHQQEGVQRNSKVIAMHREGFAELGTISKQEQVNEIIEGAFDHNLGFTRDHLEFLKENLKSCKVVFPN